MPIGRFNPVGFWSIIECYAVNIATNLHNIFTWSPILGNYFLQMAFISHKKRMSTVWFHPFLESKLLFYLFFW